MNQINTFLLNIPEFLDDQVNHCIVHNFTVRDTSFDVSHNILNVIFYLDIQNMTSRNPEIILIQK